MNARKYLLATIAAAAMAAVGLTGAGPASACEVGGQHHHSTAIANERALDINSTPADLPKALGERGPQTMRVDLETTEATGELKNGAIRASYDYRTRTKKNP